jgi:hypothetical protein
VSIKSRLVAVVSAIAMVGSALVFIDAPAALAVPTIPEDSICSLPEVILGTEGDDVLTGTAGDDIICGLGGNDQIDGLGGDDIILGGTGTDTLIGGTEDDRISGGIGDDYIDGKFGDDSIWGGAGDDSVIGDAGGDYLSGGDGADNLFGGAGIDSLLAGSGNDSLNGGADADRLNGETGVDICQKQSIDKVVSCYYDNAGPKLSNVAIDPADASLDSTDATRKLHLRFTITDPGTGLQWAFMKFAEAKYFAAARRNHSVYLDNSASQFEIYVSFNPTMPCDPNPAYTTVCSLGGTATKAVYEATVVLPRNLKTTRYYLSYYAANDQVSNQTSWDAADLYGKHLGVSFAQTGHNDIIGPSVSSLNIIGTRRLPTQESSVVAEATYADASGNGLESLTLNYKLIHPTADQTVSVIGHTDDNTYTTPCTDDITEITRACLVEGDKYSGRVRIRMTLSGWGVSGSGTLLRGNLKLVSVEAKDLAGNAHNYNRLKSHIVAATVLSESFGRAQDNDHTAPVLLSYSASKRHIDTGGGPQTVDFTYVAQDTGKGIDTSISTLTLMRPVECNGGGGTNCGASVDYCSTYSTKALSGGRVRVVTRCNFPAHYPSGTFTVSIWLRDKSSNGNDSWYASTDLDAFGSGSTLVNG